MYKRQRFNKLKLKKYYLRSPGSKNTLTNLAIGFDEIGIGFIKQSIISATLFDYVY